MTAALLAGSYAVLLLGLWLFQDKLLYFPDRGPLPAAPAWLSAERVEIPTADSLRLIGWVVPARSGAADSPWLLLFHGNAGNIATAGRPDHDLQLSRLGLNVLALDYRGYGESQGRPSEPGLYADADAAWHWLTTVRGVPPGRIVIYGHSLGSAVAIELATRVEAAGLIVEGAPTSVPDRGQEVYPFLPVRWLSRNRFASKERIGRVTCPKLFIHGLNDTTIPIRHGRRLFELAAEPKKFLAVAGGHDDAYAVDAESYERGITRFLVEIGLRPAYP